MLIEKEIKTEFEPNKEQKECIEFKTGITLALAGPGTGKTFCITKRIESLIRNNVQPDRILCLTFTEVAALEMKKRLSKTLEKSLFFLIFLFKIVVDIFLYGFFLFFFFGDHKEEFYDIGCDED